MGRDQDATAVRIVHRGLGLAPKRRPDAIARAIDPVLREPSFRTAAERMAERIHRDRDDDRLTTEFEALASSEPERADLESQAAGRTTATTRRGETIESRAHPRA
jgi:UDP:flavonoid glycosyltransferase YjiC (YdhE family)